MACRRDSRGNASWRLPSAILAGIAAATFPAVLVPRFLPARRARAGVPEDGTRHPQDTVLAKTTVFSRCFDVFFACCAAGTHFVHLSFRVKSAFPMAS